MLINVFNQNKSITQNNPTSTIPASFLAEDARFSLDNGCYGNQQHFLGGAFHRALPINNFLNSYP